MHNIDILLYIIQWCNENVGFATIVLSILTFMVSLIAVVVSIKTAQLPYKKMVKIETGDYFATGGDTGIHVTAINCGNMDFTIRQMGLVVQGKQLLINTNSNNQYPVRLKNGEQISEYFTYSNPLIQNLKYSHKIVAYVKDSEGKIYKKRMQSK